MERRSLSTAVVSIPNADPDAVRRFVTQDATTMIPSPNAKSPSASQSRPHATQRSGAITPIGMIPITVRLPPDLAAALKRASLERQLAGADLCTQQDLVARALELWFREHGCLD